MLRRFPTIFLIEVSIVSRDKLGISLRSRFRARNRLRELGGENHHLPEGAPRDCLMTAQTYSPDKNDRQIEETLCGQLNRLGEANVRRGCIRSLSCIVLSEGEMHCFFSL